GPVFIANEVPIGERTAWYAAWRLDLTLDPQCPGCKDDLSLLLPALAQKYPDDRMALLSYTQDQTIRNFMLKSPQEFQTDLYDLAAQRIDPIPSFRYFFEAGETHTLLPHPAKEVAQGV